MKKIVVIGCPGSGKSYFSMKLREKTGIEVFHLDNLYWQKDWIPLDSEIFEQKLKEQCEKDSWIIDGNYIRTMDYRCSMADTIFFLDMNVESCLKGEKERRGKKREDMPSFLEEKEDPLLIEKIKNFPEKERGQILSILEKYRDRSIFVFDNREEVNNYLKSL